MSKYSCPQATNSAQKKRRPPGRRSSKYLGNDKLTTREGFCSKTEEQAEEQAMAATLKALTAAISQADQAITELIAGDEPLTLLYAQLTSVPGVGLVLATEMLLTTNAFRDRTDPKRYASYAPGAAFRAQLGPAPGAAPRECPRQQARQGPTAPGRPFGRALVQALESLL